MNRFFFPILLLNILFLIGCQNFKLFKKDIKNKLNSNIVLAQIKEVSYDNIKVFILQSWSPKIEINEINEEMITIGDSKDNETKITFSKKLYKESQKEYCNYCFDRLSISAIKLDKLSKNLLNKNSKKRLERLKKGDFVFVELNKRNSYYLSDIFQFSNANYNILEKNLNSCLRSDFSQLINKTR